MNSPEKGPKIAWYVCALSKEKREADMKVPALMVPNGKE